MNNQAQAKANVETAAPAGEDNTLKTSSPPKDEANISGPVDAPAPPASAKLATKRRYVKPRTPEEIALDEAIAAHEKTGKAVEAAKLKVIESNRKVRFQAGQRAVHAVLLRVDRENRESTLSALLDLAEGKDKQTIIDYLDALNTAPTSKREAEKQTVD